MKKLLLLIIALLLVSPNIFPQDTGDYKLITVKEGETLNIIVSKYLRNKRFKLDLLRYNHLKANQIKAGINLKIPYSISKDRVARVKFFKGTVDKSLDDVTWTPIRQVASILLQKHHVRTAKDAKIEIQFDNGSIIQILDESIASLEEYSYTKSGVNFNLKRGSLFANVRKLRKRSTFSISTVTAVVGVRGTEFYVNIDENDKVKVEVYKGKVNVMAKNQLVVVKRGYETTVSKDSAPLKPSKIKVSRTIQWSK
ncbi:MAG: FecR family protein [Spirochaetota bacterium]|nr:FecR family protein [Spirochaetota bacterium]